MNELLPPPSPGLRDMLFGGGFVNMFCWMVIFGILGVCLLAAIFGDRKRGVDVELVFGLLRATVNCFLLLVCTSHVAAYCMGHGDGSERLRLYVQQVVAGRLVEIALFLALIGFVAGGAAVKWRRLPGPTPVGAVCLPLAIVDQVVLMILLLLVYAGAA